MYTRDYEDSLRELMENFCGSDGQITYTDNVKTWCLGHGDQSAEEGAPLKLTKDPDGKSVLVMQEILPEGSLGDRIKAMMLRGSLDNVANNPAEKLNSRKKRLAYLFMKEIAALDPELEDELLEDKWAMNELRRRNFFKE